LEIIADAIGEYKPEDGTFDNASFLSPRRIYLQLIVMALRAEPEEMAA